MTIQMPPDVERILSRLNAGGYEAYIVGGCVRDSIMGKMPVDWDIATAAEPAQIKRLFARTHDTGIAHGTVTVVLHKQNYEVTTFRVDGEYFDGRHPSEVSFTRSFREDLLRRDFTVNAIGYHSQTGFVDPFDGRADIVARVLRGVGDPGQRFREDGLRMLRAIRFAAQLGFTVEEHTWAALRENAALIQNISLERVRDELLKLLAADAGKLSLLSDSGLMDYIDPALAEQLKHFDPRLIHAAPELRLTMLLRGLGNNKTRMKTLRLDNRTIDLVTTLLAELETPVLDDEPPIRHRLSKIGPEVFAVLLRLFEAYGEDMHSVREKTSAILARGDCIRLSSLAVNGNDLKALGIADGREIGRVLAFLFAHVLAVPEDNTPERLTALAAQTPHL